MSKTPSDVPVAAEAEQGVVILDGPHGVVASLTPDAARKTGNNLITAASLADEQIGNIASDSAPDHPDAVD